MTRREILKYTALATGATVVAPLTTVFLSGCQSEVVKTSSFEPAFFTKSSFKVLQKIVDLIIPKTDSPGALELGVAETIDEMVHKAYDKDAQSEYQNGWKAMLKSFNVSTTDADLDNALSSLNLEALKNLDSSEDEKNAVAKSALLQIKQQTVAYYLSTETIGKNYLNYLPVPGKYESCIQLADVGGKAWSI